MDVLDWIHDNARYKRTITSVALRTGLGRQKGHCTWCDGPLPKRCTRWCSVSCEEEGYIRFGYWHGPVLRRDAGICAICGFDLLACQARVKRLVSKAKGNCGRGRYYPQSFSRIRKFSCRTGIYQNGQPYEVDHIIPVVEGGGCCGLDNLRTLCFVCHSQVTKALAASRASQRHDSKRPLLTT